MVMSAPSDAHIEQLCNQLQHHGSAVMDTQNGKLAFIMTDGLNMLGGITVPSPSILVAWETQGAFFWDISTSINAFSLTASGFSLKVSPTLADILQRVAACIKASGGDEIGAYLPR